MAKAPSQDIQTKGVLHVRDTFIQYKDLLESYRSRLTEVYREYATYNRRGHNRLASDQGGQSSPDFKVNKAHEVVEKVLPRVMARNPKWIVVPRTNDFTPDELPERDGTEEAEITRNEEIKKRKDQTLEFSRGIQDYLSYIFDEYNLNRQVRLWAKNMITYGIAWCKVQYKREEVVVTDRVKGEDVTKTEVAGEYPTLDIKSWSDIYWDPRNPKWIVVPRTNDFTPDELPERDGTEEAEITRNEEIKKQ